MNRFTNLLRLNFIPTSTDLALLALRLWFGLCMLLLHGWDKFANYSDRLSTFSDPLGIGSPASLTLAVFGEFFCSILLVAGLFTRFAALTGLITMAVAFFLAHEGAFTGPRSGELAFMYLGAYVTLLIAGGGRFSLDRNLFRNA